MLHIYLKIIGEISCFRVKSATIEISEIIDLSDDFQKQPGWNNQDAEKYNGKKKQCIKVHCFLIYMAPRAGLEPATNGLTVRCSTNWAIEELL